MSAEAYLVCPDTLSGAKVSGDMRVLSETTQTISYQPYFCLVSRLASGLIPLGGSRNFGESCATTRKFAGVGKMYRCCMAFYKSNREESASLLWAARKGCLAFDPASKALDMRSSLFLNSLRYGNAFP
jgi:hypothetical protein